MIGRVLAGGGGIAPVLAGYAPRGFFDHFDAAALGADWTVRLGTWSLAASRATAATIALDGNNQITNGEFTADTAGWDEVLGAVISRVDSEVDPGVNSGGADRWCLKVISNAGNSVARWITVNPAALEYQLSVRMFSPSSNAQTKAARANFLQGNNIALDAQVEDAWHQRSANSLGITGDIGKDPNCWLFWQSIAAGDVAYFDSINVQVYRALATVTRGNANATVQAGIVMPATGVAPFGVVARYQDLANYWCWEVIPGTAGNDFQLVRMQAGVRTVLATADIDWVAETAYTLKFEHVGNVYTGYVNDVARLSYTDGASFLATETAFGIIEGKTSNGGFDWFQLN